MQLELCDSGGVAIIKIRPNIRSFRHAQACVHETALEYPDVMEWVLRKNGVECCVWLRQDRKERFPEIVRKAAWLDETAEAKNEIRRSAS
jgi:hypothetical protein